MIQWAAFDVGETLFDEHGLWGRWADWLGVPREDFRAELSRLIQSGRHHREVFDRFRPGFDMDATRAERLAAGDEPGFRPEDLFGDVRACLDALKARGIKVAIAGNNPRSVEVAIERSGLAPDLVASSERWGAEKPAAAFFEALQRACGVRPARIAYVGDRIDNDAIAATRAGMTGIWLRRGLWAEVQRDWPDAHGLPHVIDTLAELPALLDRLAGP